MEIILKGMPSTVSTTESMTRPSNTGSTSSEVTDTRNTLIGINVIVSSAIMNVILVNTLRSSLTKKIHPFLENQ